MTIQDFLTFLTRVFYLLVALVALGNLIRHRDRMRADIALLFGSLAVVIFGQIVRPAVLDNPFLLPIVSILTNGLTMSLGYFILRIVQHFRPVPRWIILFAVIGLAISWLIFIVFAFLPDTQLPTPLLMLLVGYLVFLIGYEAWSFIRGAIGTKGVTRWRLILVAIATGFLTMVFALAGIVNFLPQAEAAETQGSAEQQEAPNQITAREVAGILSGSSGMLSGLFFYLGFAPPRWLRRTWQLTELHKFLQSSSIDLEESPQRLMARLADFAVRTVGGMKAIAGLWDDSTQSLIFEGQTAYQDALSTLIDEPNVTAKVWRERKPRFLSRSDASGASEARLASEIDSKSMFVIPVSKAEHPLGLLLVFMRYSSLFPDDDLDILRLLAEQSATDLEYTKLLEEQRVLVQKLNRRSDQLEEANRELEAFAYTVSHDLRAPLRAVDGFGNILHEDYRQLLPEDGKETLDFILQNSKQMGQLIDDLLMFSRLGRTQVVRETVKMKELVEEIVDDQMRTLNGRDIEIKVADLPETTANRNLLKQVLTNLISNAIKFTRARDHAEIEVGSQRDEQGQTVYYIRDNGVGFDMAYYNKLFGVFQRLQNPEDYEGTGVGLAIVQRVIRKHGGRVWAEAEPGKGATFYFTIGEPETE